MFLITCNLNILKNIYKLDYIVNKIYWISQELLDLSIKKF